MNLWGQHSVHNARGLSRPGGGERAEGRRAGTITDRLRPSGLPASAPLPRPGPALPLPSFWLVTPPSGMISDTTGLLIALVQSSLSAWSASISWHVFSLLYFIVFI